MKTNLIQQLKITITALSVFFQLSLHAQTTCITNIVSDGDFSQLISNSLWTKTNNSWGVTNGYVLAVDDNTKDNLSQTFGNIDVSSGNIVIKFKFATNNGLNSGTDPNISTATLNILFKGVKYLSLTNPAGYATGSAAPVIETTYAGATVGGESPKVSSALNNLTFYNITLTIPYSGSQPASGTLTFQYNALTPAGIDDIAIDNVNVQGYPSAPVLNPASTSLSGCPTVDLTQSILSTTPPGYSLVWYTANSPTGQPVADPTAVAAPGTYYAYYTNGTCTTGGSTAVQVTSTCTPMPVKLLNFNAALQNKAVQLNWQTTTEINNKGFTIQRSSDGAQDFTNIGYQESLSAGYGNSSSILSYGFTDNSPNNGANYYRLLQTDLNGNSSYSNIVEVNTTGNTTLQIYPNPAHGTINLNGLPIGANVAIYNANGQLVKCFVAISASQQVDISGLSSGVYFVKILGSNISQRFIIQ